MWLFFLIGHLYIEWYVAKVEVKNKYQKYMCPDGIGQCAHNTNIVVGSIDNMSMRERERERFDLL